MSVFLVIRYSVDSAPEMDSFLKRVQLEIQNMRGTSITTWPNKDD
jgi:hypothetical protein